MALSEAILLDDLKIEQDNPGSGSCLFYSISISLMPILRDEILSGRFEEKDSRYQKLLPYFEKIIKDEYGESSGLNLKEMILSFRHDGFQEGSKNFQTLVIFSKLLRQYLVSHNISEVKAAFEAKNPKAMESVKVIEDIKKAIDYHDGSFREKVKKIVKKENRKDEVWRDKTRKFNPEIEKHVKMFNKWWPKSKVISEFDRQAREESLQMYVLTQLSDPVKGAELFLQAEDNYKNGRPFKNLRFTSGFAQFREGSPLMDFLKDKLRDTHWGSEVDASKISSLLDVNLSIMETTITTAEKNVGEKDPSKPTIRLTNKMGMHWVSWISTNEHLYGIFAEKKFNTTEIQNVLNDFKKIPEVAEIIKQCEEGIALDQIISKCSDLSKNKKIKGELRERLAYLEFRFKEQGQLQSKITPKTVEEKKPTYKSLMSDQAYEKRRKLSQEFHDQLMRSAEGKIFSFHEKKDEATSAYVQAELSRYVPKMDRPLLSKEEILNVLMQHQNLKGRNSEVDDIIKKCKDPYSKISVILKDCQKLMDKTSNGSLKIAMLYLVERHRYGKQYYDKQYVKSDVFKEFSEGYQYSEYVQHAKESILSAEEIKKVFEECIDARARKILQNPEYKKLWDSIPESTRKHKLKMNSPEIKEALKGINMEIFNGHLYKDIPDDFKKLIAEGPTDAIIEFCQKNKDAKDYPEDLRKVMTYIILRHQCDWHDMDIYLQSGVGGGRSDKYQSYDYTKMKPVQERKIASSPIREAGYESTQGGIVLTVEEMKQKSAPKDHKFDDIVQKLNEFHACSFYERGKKSQIREELSAHVLKHLGSPEKIRAMEVYFKKQNDEDPEFMKKLVLTLNKTAAHKLRETGMIGRIVLKEKKELSNAEHKRPSMGGVH